jgi:hypothetical protein
LSVPASHSPDFIRYVAKTYKDDFNGYREDILGMKPAEWQNEVGTSLMRNKRTAVSSGHGIGKTGLAASAIHWFLATRPRPAIIATANTENQLKGKLWREIAKINVKAKNKEWFEWKASTFTMFGDVTAQAVALPWSDSNPEAFQGTHEDHVLGVFDEASSIPRSIFNAFAGAMSTAGARWLIVGNPTSAEGYFHDACHGKLRALRVGDESRGLWKSFIVGCARSPFVDPSYIDDMRRQHGEDSDEFRIRVLGLPPRQSVTQFYNTQLVEQAMTRELEIFKRWPLVIGCDVGRGDRSVLFPRRGRVGLDRVEIINGSRTTDFARRIVDEIKFYREEHGLQAQIILEELGMGVGVVETLEDMGYADQTWGVNTGDVAREPDLYTNLRCEMNANLKDWLEGNVMLPNCPALQDDMINIRRKPDGGNGRLKLETKDEMRKRGVPSPDVLDALALTFAVDFDLLPEKRDAWADAWKEQAGAGGGTWASN